MSIELPATSRHRRDMIEKLLKAKTLSPNQTKKQTKDITDKNIASYATLYTLKRHGDRLGFGVRFRWKVMVRATVLYLP